MRDDSRASKRGTATRNVAATLIMAAWNDDVRPPDERTSMRLIQPVTDNRFGFEEAPFGELRVGAAAFEAMSQARTMTGSGTTVEFFVSCVDADPNLSFHVGGGSQRRLALCWVSPAGFVPRTHVWPLRVNAECRQVARVGHLFCVVDAARVPGLGERDVSCATLAAEAIFASYVPRRLDPYRTPHGLLVSVTSDAVARLAAVPAPAAVRALVDARDGALGALHWVLAEEAGALCDVGLLATYVSNAARPDGARRTIKVTNARFARGVAASRGARALLFVLGFRAVDGEAIRVEGVVDRTLFEEVAALLRAPPGQDPPPPWTRCSPDAAGEAPRGGFLQSDARWNRPGFQGRRPPPPPPGSAPSSNGRWGR